jgi:hypothetical protein
MLHAKAKQSMPYMQGWNNIARSYKIKTSVPVNI